MKDTIHEVERLAREGWVNFLNKNYGPAQFCYEQAMSLCEDQTLHIRRNELKTFLFMVLDEHANAIKETQPEEALSLYRKIFSLEQIFNGSLIPYLQLLNKRGVKAVTEERYGDALSYFNEALQTIGQFSFVDLSRVKAVVIKNQAVANWRQLRQGGELTPTVAAIHEETPRPDKRQKI